MYTQTHTQTYTVSCEGVVVGLQDSEQSRELSRVGGLSMMKKRWEAEDVLSGALCKTAIRFDDLWYNAGVCVCV